MGSTREAAGLAVSRTFSSSPLWQRCATSLRSSARRLAAISPSALLATRRHGREDSPGMYCSNSCARSRGCSENKSSTSAYHIVADKLGLE
eukprot:scaffold82087_cov33-Tisochrysis_lutea.AAC.2